ncbi:substrate-binding periplasmic protein [Candidatus Auribacterota bacterium]
MKSKLKFIILLSIGIFSFLFIQKIYSEPAKIKIAYQNTDNFPFQLGEGSDIDFKKPGLAVELLVLVGERLNIEITFVRFPWKRGEKELKAGRIDGLFSASFKTKRLELGVYPMKEGKVDPARKNYSNSYALYKLKGSSLSWDGKAFQHVSGPVGAPRGFSIVDDLKKHDIQVEETTSTLQNLKKLVRGRLAGVATLDLLGDFFLREHKEMFKNIEKVEPLLVTKPYYLMLSHQFVKKNQKLAEKIWDNIALVRHLEEYKQLSVKYFE